MAHWWRRRSLTGFLVALALAVLLLVSWGRQGQLVWSQTPPKPVTALSIEPYFYSAQFAQGEAMLRERLKQTPTDDQARFGLGMMQLMAGVERLSQSLYRYGLRHNWLTEIFPILRLPIPNNNRPETLSYQAVGEILQTWLTDLTAVQATLEPIVDSTVKLPLRLGAFRLDINNDGRVTDNESFRRLFEVITRSRVSDADARAFQISFDYGDVLWLRGYCHLLSAIAEIVLAHDGRKLFDATAHLFFAKPESPYPFLQQRGGPFEFTSDFNFSDLVAFVHLLQFPVVEPARLGSALNHLQATLSLSRQSWQAISKETDNDSEWLPNPRQTGVVPGVRVTQEMIDGWLQFVTEAEQLLAGKVLAPFWRGDQRNTAQGVNLNRLFTDPCPVDVVLWIQGSAAAP
ncbi:MAG: hypothetical protein NZ772_18955, partial [Cyanobacteria bacterium]|nr:hypothetical protein [Cyanobacteriota bacterium]MDW8203306.1 hypothetical protein [Cyanobacteriota bacterium SKYGB_h_bin112]